MIWYRVTKWDENIRDIEVVRETEKQLVVKFSYFGREGESRVFKASSDTCYFKTKEDAIKWKRTILERHVKDTKLKYQRAIAKQKDFEESLSV